MTPTLAYAFDHVHHTALDYFLMVCVVALYFWIVQLVDVTRRQFRDPSSKTVWTVVIVLLGVLGALIYYFAGRKQGALPGQEQRSDAHD
jgi:hypothetical protein